MKKNHKIIHFDTKNDMCINLRKYSKKFLMYIFSIICKVFQYV